MCGIFCTITQNDGNCEKYWNLCEKYIKRRGPDTFDTLQFNLQQNTKLFLAASVLWLQGNKITKQPLTNDKSSFIYNGDVFEDFSTTEEVRLREGDTVTLKNLLDVSKNIQETLRNIQGPFSLIYYDKEHSKLHFCRDVYGRRSLLIGKDGNNIIISSVLCKELNCIELPPLGVYTYDFLTQKLSLVIWNNTFETAQLEVKIKQLETYLEVVIDVNFQNLQTFSKIQYFEPDLEVIDILKNVPFEDGIVMLLNDLKSSQRVEELRKLLEESVRKRVNFKPPNCEICSQESLENCTKSSLAILFSGGLDCTILALLSDKFLDENSKIDLINVSFDWKNSYNSPDRLTGIKSYEEIVKLRPKRKWNFIEINVTPEEVNNERSKHIRHLIHPLNTILDDSLGCVMWFGGKGCSDKSHSRIILVGTGADELFGGYTKHRAALKRNGWLGLGESLLEDWRNISVRNLARDDRVIADHGRQLRSPYLDENVVNYLMELQPWEKTLPIEGLFKNGVGEKVLLRILGFHLGLRNVAQFKKRAMQFGSRIANKKENATDVSPRL